MTAPTTLPPPAWTPRGYEYHKLDGHWSSSMLKRFRESPQDACDRYVTRTAEEEEPSPQMVIGSVVNTLLLRPDRFDAEIIVANTSGRSKESRRLAEENPTKTVATGTEFETAEAVAGAIQKPRSRAAEVGRFFLTEAPGYSEYAHRWRDPFGVDCKIMLDRGVELALEQPAAAIIELKATADPTDEGFSAQISRMGYDAQAAFYLRGMQQALGAYPLFFWVAVGNSPPHDVYVYQLSDEYAVLGSQMIERDLRAVSQRLSGELPWMADGQILSGKIPKILPPAWRYRELHNVTSTVVGL